MKDQCCKLEERGILATVTGCSQNDVCIDDKIRNKNFKIVNTTPEKFCSYEVKPISVFKELIEQATLDYWLLMKFI